MDKIKKHYKVDEYDVDFSDTREFVAKRWEDAVLALNENLSAAGKLPSLSSVLNETTDY
jgi:hypothetical protein